MRIDLLDHGYIELVEHWGSDERIIESARMSTGKGFLGWGPKEDGGPGDERLLRFLWENKHSTPFEMGGATVEVQAPILVFREWHRHRTQSYAELSARYTPLPDVNYIPSTERLLLGSDGKNKQAGTVKDAAVLTEEGARNFQEGLRQQYAAAESLYRSALDAGVPKELARAIVPVGRYSRMRATANLRNWLQFLALRMAPGAQWEIRQYANALGERILAEIFPRTWTLFAETLKGDQ